MIKPRTLSTLKQCLARKGFDAAQQAAIIERGTVKSFGNRAQLVMAAQDVPAVGFQCIEAQI
jgi:hypothetical protein